MINHDHRSQCCVEPIIYRCLCSSTSQQDPNRVRITFDSTPAPAFQASTGASNTSIDFSILAISHRSPMSPEAAEEPLGRKARGCFKTFYAVSVLASLVRRHVRPTRCSSPRYWKCLRTEATPWKRDRLLREEPQHHDSLPCITKSTST